MSKSAELEVMEGMITIEGVKPTRTALVFAKVDEGTLRRAGLFLQSVDACAAWWWGDFLAAYCGYEIKAEEDEHGPMDELTRGDRLKQYSARYAVIAGKEPKTLWQYLWIARTFANTSRRREVLTWSHHVEVAGVANGDEAVADEWLDAAVKNSWSRTDLRAAIRKTRREATGEDEGPAAQTLLPIELVACRRFASAHIASVAHMDVEEARAHLAELQQVYQYIIALTNRCTPIEALNTANTAGPPLAAAHLPRGKESLSAAA
jgi:hypothetical protein